MNIITLQENTLFVRENIFGCRKLRSFAIRTLSLVTQILLAINKSAYNSTATHTMFYFLLVLSIYFVHLYHKYYSLALFYS